MTITAQPQTDRPDPSAIAAQNDAFRKLACLGVPPAQPIQGRMHVTRSLMEAGDGFMAEAVKATGEFATFEPENDPEGWHDFGAVEIRGETVFWKLDLYEADSGFSLRGRDPGQSRHHHARADHYAGARLVGEGTPLLTAQTMKAPLPPKKGKAGLLSF